MRKRRALLAILTAMTGVAVISAILLRSLPDAREPSYQGKALSHWVIGLRRPLTAATVRDTERALRAIGTNAVPHLAKWVTYDKPKWKATLYRGANKLRSMLSMPPLEDRRQVLAKGAALALSLFDVPPDVRLRATLVEHMAYLRSALTSTDPAERLWATNRMTQAATNSRSQ